MLRKGKPRDFLVAESPAMRGVVESIARFADCDSPVLICGEHGTGRELVARVLHMSSPRRDARFLAVRPTLEGPEGSGGEDADDRARRVLRAAAGGTLLIKDVVELPAQTQRTIRKVMKDRRRVDTPSEVYDV